jgi:Putative oxalocrotonate tautomerase enzyme
MTMLMFDVDVVGEGYPGLSRVLLKGPANLGVKCQTMKPHLQARLELEWELHIAETPRNLWRINGIDPPPKDSEAEKIWKEQDKALPYES